MKTTKLIDQFQRARGSTDLAVIEGVQALKHAVRFDAELVSIVTADKAMLSTLLEELAPDVTANIVASAEEVNELVFNRLSPQPPRTKVIALAWRTNYTITDIPAHKPLILLEEPRDLENIGAVIRVAAAADAGGVCSTGPIDMWHPAVIRGAAGLQFALPVLSAQIKAVLKQGRPLISLDPTGEDISTVNLSSNSILVFGTERHGISQELLAQSEKVVKLPMKEGVSSLNLATSVAATLYSTFATLK